MTKFSIGDKLDLPESMNIQGVISAIQVKPVMGKLESVLCYGIDWQMLSCEFQMFEKVTATDNPIHCLTIAETIEKAAKVGETRTLLKKRLEEAKSCLKDDWAFCFQGATFDFEQKRLVSPPFPFTGRPPSTLSHQRYTLQWILRTNLSIPESHENQQTSCGRVVIGVA